MYYKYCYNDYEEDGEINDSFNNNNDSSLNLTNMKKFDEYLQKEKIIMDYVWKN